MAFRYRCLCLGVGFTYGKSERVELLPAISQEEYSKAQL